MGDQVFFPWSDAMSVGIAEIDDRREHCAFIERISNAANKQLVEGKSVSFEIIGFLKRWLQDHILVTDRKYASALQDTGYSTTAWVDFASNAMASKQSETARHRQWWSIW